MEKKTYFHRIQEQTATRFWINNVTREEARIAMKAGAVGCTQNPSYTWKMISEPEEAPYVRQKLDSILKTVPDDSAALVLLQKELVGQIAELFRPLYESSAQKFGYVSIQGDPFLEDTESILRFARLNREAGPNIMTKIPATEAGLAAIEVLAAERVPINATECMAVRQALDVCRIYEKATRGMKDPAPLYYSVITGIYDEYLQKYAQDQGIDVSQDALWQSGISIAKKIYWMVKEKGYPCGFIGGGARGLHHFTEMVGADCAVTINWKGTAEDLIKQDLPVIQRFFQPTPCSVIDELLEKVTDYRRAYLVNAIAPHEYEEFGPVVHFRVSFEKAWKNALESIRQRRAELSGGY